MAIRAETGTLWGRRRPTPGVFMTCTVICGNGFGTPIGVITRICLLKIRCIMDTRAPFAFFAAAVGTTVLRSAVLRSATGAARRARTSTAAFVSVVVVSPVSLHGFLGFLNTWALEIFLDFEKKHII